MTRHDEAMSDETMTSDATTPSDETAERDEPMERDEPRQITQGLLDALVLTPVADPNGEPKFLDVKGLELPQAPQAAPTPVIYFHDFWRRWILAREAARPRASRGTVLGILSAIASLPQ